MENEKLIAIAKEKYQMKCGKTPEEDGLEFSIVRSRQGVIFRGYKQVILAPDEKNS